jgi:hypothetical protein
MTLKPIAHKLPLGIQSFQKIRDKSQGYIYVDKTQQALALIDRGVYYFLSRPRRFGKSLFLDTLKSIFEAKQTLFTGLFIEDKWNWTIEYPVIKLSFGAGVIKDATDLNKRVITLLKKNQQHLEVECEEWDNARDYFENLIIAAYKKYQQKVVILVDEYDKPILDNITEQERARYIRDELKNIYSVIKESDPYLKFVFLTGVTKFSRVSLFSGLNNLTDISLMKDYATICGYTQHDVEHYFSAYLKDINRTELKEWYNGYNFLGETVYNPYNILLFFNNHAEYRNYWFETGSPSFLLKVLMKNNYYLPDLENISLSEIDLSSFDINDIKVEMLLFQTGYLTIKHVEVIFNQRIYHLTYPNLEVRSALNNAIFKYLFSKYSVPKLPLFNAILGKDMQQFERAIYQLFAAIPNNNYTKNTIQNYEGYYASVMYSYLAGLGIGFIAEDVTNKGRIDITIATPDMAQVYIIEFKVQDKPAKHSNALQQIKQNNYHEKYQHVAQDLYLVGIVFCKAERNICQFDWERI